MIPTTQVGSTVFYKLPDTAHMLPAIVTKVYPDGTLALFVMRDGGYPPKSVPTASYSPTCKALCWTAGTYGEADDLIPPQGDETAGLTAPAPAAAPQPPATPNTPPGPPQGAPQPGLDLGEDNLGDD